MGHSYQDGIVEFSPGPIDVHAHPRVFDPIVLKQTIDGELEFGKAGLPIYTEAALKCGITVLSAMPNESKRIIDFNSTIETRDKNIIKYPISNADRSLDMETRVIHESLIRMTYHLGLDPKEIIYGDDDQLDTAKMVRNFVEAGVNASALKVYGDITNGGYNVPTKHIPEIVDNWYSLYPKKPVIMHLEDGNVDSVLREIDKLENSKDIKIHIAHVSSKQELEAVIAAKERGMRVTCEVTPHHLFVDATDGNQIGGFGCMKPRLKSDEDVRFIWDNLDYVDVFASDCAPHRIEDKLQDNPAFGVTNHTVMMQLLFGAVEEGRLTLEQVYDKTCINPRRIFNIPRDDRTVAMFDLNRGFELTSDIEQLVLPRYGQNIFEKLEDALGNRYHLLGHLVFARSGLSVVGTNISGELEASYTLSRNNLVKVRV